MEALYAHENKDYVTRESGATASNVFYLFAISQKVNMPPIGSPVTQFRDAYAKIKWLNCPAFPKTGHPICFVINGFDPNNVGSDGLTFLKLSRIRRPNQTVNFADGNENLPSDEFSVYDLWQTGHLAANASTPITPTSSVGRVLSDKRHKGNLNLSFYDGHVEVRQYKKLVLWDFVNN